LIADIASRVSAALSNTSNNGILNVLASITAVSAVGSIADDIIRASNTRARTTVKVARLAGTLANAVITNRIEKVGQRRARVVALTAVSSITGQLHLTTVRGIVVAIFKPSQTNNVASRASTSRRLSHIRESLAIISTSTTVSAGSREVSLTTKVTSTSQAVAKATEASWVDARKRSGITATSLGISTNGRSTVSLTISACGIICIRSLTTFISGSRSAVKEASKAISDADTTRARDV